MPLAGGSGPAQQILERGDSFADLLEADFPDGLPDEGDEGDEDAIILDEIEEDVDAAPAAEVGEDSDEMEHLKSLEDLAGIDDTAETNPDDDFFGEDDED